MDLLPQLALILSQHHLVYHLIVVFQHNLIHKRYYRDYYQIVFYIHPMDLAHLTHRHAPNRFGRLHSWDIFLKWHLKQQFDHQIFLLHHIILPTQFLSQDLREQEMSTYPTHPSVGWISLVYHKNMQGVFLIQHYPEEK